VSPTDFSSTTTDLLGWIKCALRKNIPFEMDSSIYQGVSLHVKNIKVGNADSTLISR